MGRKFVLMKPLQRGKKRMSGSDSISFHSESTVQRSFSAHKACFEKVNFCIIILFCVKNKGLFAEIFALESVVYREFRAEMIFFSGFVKCPDDLVASARTTP